jgi:hypothetical protein
MLNAIIETYYAAFVAWTIGYIWFLITDANVLNAILMLTGMALAAVACIMAAVTAIVWIARHVRIVIV